MTVQFGALQGNVCISSRSLEVGSQFISRLCLWVHADGHHGVGIQLKSLALLASVHYHGITGRDTPSLVMVIEVEHEVLGMCT